MTKRKRTSRSLLGHIWNEFLFTRYFEYETDLSPHEVADSIRDLAQEQEERFWRRVQTAHVEMYPNNKGLDFEVRNKRKHPGDVLYLTTARTQGSVAVDGGTGKTMIRGSVKFGRSFHLLLVLFLIYFIFFFPPLFTESMRLATGLSHLMLIVIPSLILGLAMTYYWWRIYQDRNLMVKRIDDAMMAGDSEAAAQRLSERDDYAESRQGPLSSALRRYRRRDER